MDDTVQVGKLEEEEGPIVMKSDKSRKSENRKCEPEYVQNLRKVFTFHLLASLSRRTTDFGILLHAARRRLEGGGVVSSGRRIVTSPNF